MCACVCMCARALCVCVCIIYIYNDICVYIYVAIYTYIVTKYRSIHTRFIIRGNSIFFFLSQLIKVFSGPKEVTDT